MKTNYKHILNLILNEFGHQCCRKKVKFYCQQPSMILETKGVRADFPYGKYDSWLPREYFLLFIFFFTWRYTVEKGTLFLQHKSGNSACDSDIKRKLKGSCLGKKNLNCLTTLPLRSSKQVLARELHRGSSKMYLEFISCQKTRNHTISTDAFLSTFKTRHLIRWGGSDLSLDRNMVR